MEQMSEPIQPAERDPLCLVCCGLLQRLPGDSAGDSPLVCSWWCPECHAWRTPMLDDVTSPAGP